MIFKKVLVNKSDNKRYVILPRSGDILPGDTVLIIKCDPVDIYKDAIRVRKGKPSILEGEEKIVDPTPSEIP